MSLGASIVLSRLTTTVTSLALGTALQAQVPSAACTGTAPLSPGGPPAAGTATGVSIGVLDSAAVSSLAGRTLSDALAARIPGVSVMRSSGISGTGSRVVIRGAYGIYAAQRPLLFVDGIRVDDELHSIGLSTGGQAPSRLDDIPLDQVACVHVLRGPAATAQYGTDAVGGVIHVTTRSATAATSDSTRAHAFLDAGGSANAVKYPANYGTTGTPPNTTTRSWSPLEADSPFRFGRLVTAGGSVSGAVGRVMTGTLHGSTTFDDGVLRNNDQRRYSIGAAATLTPHATIAIHTRAWLLDGSARLPFEGNLILSGLRNGLAGRSADDPFLRGYLEFPRSVFQAFDTDQRVRRIGGGLDGVWRPARWLAAGAMVGREDSRVADEQDNPWYAKLPDGNVVLQPSTSRVTAENRTQRNTAAAFVTTSLGTEAISSATTVSVTYASDTRRFEERACSLGPNGCELGSWRWRSGGLGTTRGITVRQALASRDRRFVEAGLRRDHLDDFIVDIDDPTYPFASASWIASAESFYPRNPVVSSVRLRAAYGESGDRRPYEIAILQGLATVVPIGTPSPDDEPIVERNREIEWGADFGIANDRIAISATGFRKRTTDALIDIPLAPGLGTPQSRLATDAAWDTRGTEISAQGRVLQTRSVTMELALSYSSVRNTVRSLGDSPPRHLGSSIRTAVGYPLRAYWAPSFTYADANGDGVLDPTEVTAGTEWGYVGSPTPTREAGLSPSITIARALTVSALLDYRGGFRQYNLTERRRCDVVCAARHVPGSSLADQARAVDPVDAERGWIERGDFVRLREVAAVWAMPPSVSRLIGARRASLTAAGRNLASWTDYSGLDPEVALDGQARMVSQDFFTLPLVRTFSMRLDVRW
ncbi:MAG TPA: TonB-dependent receptor plug domain-containing protein [Gemmatimonadaceae bacterium]|jgi:hypothetical protein|nr:TonB-dependent receptor plug domain-containing protein [Gemmatimonadaceae bacterium]